MLTGIKVTVKYISLHQPFIKTFKVNPLKIRFFWWYCWITIFHSSSLLVLPLSVFWVFHWTGYVWDSEENWDIKNWKGGIPGIQSSDLLTEFVGLVRRIWENIPPFFSGIGRLLLDVIPRHPGKKKKVLQSNPSWDRNIKHFKCEIGQPPDPPLLSFWRRSIFCWSGDLSRAGKLYSVLLSLYVILALTKDFSKIISGKFFFIFGCNAS